MTLPLGPGRYALDLTHTQIGFAVTHLGLTPIRGVFARFDGGLDDSGSHPSRAVGAADPPES
ncbi:MAG: hypothetical protein R2755_18780 [Acidimicrobiales bacterium]